MDEGLQFWPGEFSPVNSDCVLNSEYFLLFDRLAKGELTPENKDRTVNGLDIF